MKLHRAAPPASVSPPWPDADELGDATKSSAYPGYSRRATLWSSRYTRRLHPFWDGERITSLRTLAIGEPVGEAGPDSCRSPMMRPRKPAEVGYFLTHFEIASGQPRVSQRSALA
jgi:hypothetical protein